MKSKKILRSLATAAVLLGVGGQAFAGDPGPNKRRGQVYFKMVCTVCHMESAARAIPPASRSMDEWRAYFDADRHDSSGKTDPRVTFYMSREYRESIKDSNKAAKKFLDLSNEQIYADVREFVVNGARDSDTPASCN